MACLQRTLLGGGAPHLDPTAPTDGVQVDLVGSSCLPADDVEGLGIYASGELGHYWLGTASPFFGSIDLPDYTYWNLGVALTWKVFTIHGYPTPTTIADTISRAVAMRG